MWLNFTPEITRIKELPGASPPGPPPGRFPGFTGGLKAAPRPNASEKKKSKLPLTRIPGSAPKPPPGKKINRIKLNYIYKDLHRSPRFFLRLFFKYSRVIATIA